MRNQKGVTVVSLIVTIILLLMLASITVSTSLSSYKTMKYQTFKAELEEIQDAVNEISESYSLEKELNSSISYSDYFTDKFGSSPQLVGESTTVDGVSNVVALYAALTTNSQYTYYFSEDDIKTYLGLEVTLDGVLVDFSTRYVYSVTGCEDPYDSDQIYYTLSEMDGETNIYENETSSASATSGLSASNDNSNTLYTSGDTKLLKVTLTFKRSSSGINYPMKKAYYSTDGGTTYIEVDYLGDCTYSDDGESVSFVIYTTGEYYFKAEDTYGTTTSPISVTYK